MREGGLLPGLAVLGGVGRAGAVHAYLLAPALQAAAVSEFHALGLAPPFIAWAIYAVERRQWGRCALACILLMAVQEGMALQAVLLGTYALVRAVTGEGTEDTVGTVGSGARRGPAAGSGIALLGLAWFYVTIFRVIPTSPARSMASARRRTHRATVSWEIASAHASSKASDATLAWLRRCLPNRCGCPTCSVYSGRRRSWRCSVAELLLLSLPLLWPTCWSTFPLQYRANCIIQRPWCPISYLQPVPACAAVGPEATFHFSSLPGLPVNPFSARSGRPFLHFV